jgi:hypothetical protein
MTRPQDPDAVRALCRALDGRGVGPLVARLDDASVLSVPGLSGLGGDYQGREAIVGLLRRMAAATNRTLRFQAQGTLVSQRGALHIEGRLAGTRDGRLFGTTVSVDATLDGQMLRSITIECSDRSTWDTLWGRARQ